MVPTTEQKLRSVRHTIAATVLPAIGADERFAKEQAGLVLATLDWILDVQASEYRYEVVEHGDATALVHDLAALGDAATGTTHGTDAEPAPVLPTDLAELRALVLAAKQEAEERFSALLGTDRADEAWAVMSAAAKRQSAREVAAARMTGFPTSPSSLAEVLADQERDLDRRQAEQEGAR
ncbi:hypothetical protein [Curtobacterium sp. RRHDQ10]|uniref:hypothetical protein n=1 Tax=Curtobacterium phyllosphaerae TaxID=3413379 RepID=UPI003BF15936